MTPHVSLLFDRSVFLSKRAVSYTSTLLPVHLPRSMKILDNICVFYENTATKVWNICEYEQCVFARLR